MTKITVLGCGHAGGTPMVGEGWGAADPENSKNSRLRPSILVEQGNTRVLVDTSPDLRQQLLNAKIDRLDAILYTHAHADHLHGIDDLRSVNRSMQADIPAYADVETWRQIDERFGYIMAPLKPDVTFYYKPVLQKHVIAIGEAFKIGDIDVEVFDQDHGYSRSLGFRFGAFAYSTDVVNFPDESFAALAGIDTWLVDALVDYDHPTHAHVDKVIDWSKRLTPRRTILTHLSHRLDYATLASQLPAGMEPAYDGMIIDV
jgi:phosphoribosyl 1,2-cyclic phosphate phosphodiesterase